MDCVFCQIISGNLPAGKVYDDNDFLAIMDTHPTVKGHMLLMPKKHVENVEDADPELMAAAARLVKTLGNKIIQNLGVPGYNVVINNGAVAGQVVPHLHWHLIPRQFNDGLKPWPAAQDYAVGEMEEVLSKLRTN